jgi:DNA-binding response OmpR family regulator
VDFRKATTMLAAPMEQESQRRVLVVDDDGIIRGVLERKLAAQGYLISTAGSGSGALDLLRDGAIDLVLLDLELPDQSGIDALRQIRLSHSAIDLPVIMVTGRDATESVIEALDETANDYVTKPVDFPVLMARIKIPHPRRKDGKRVASCRRIRAGDSPPSGPGAIRDERIGRGACRRG